MKKQIAIIVAGLAAVCCLGGCKSKSSGGSEYDMLNNMLNAHYSEVLLTVTNTFDEDISLCSTYLISYSDSEITVEYAVERFAEVSLDDSQDGAIITSEGTATIRDGVVVSVLGDNIGLTADIATLRLTFKSNYFTNTLYTPEFFIADVKNPSGFLGTQLTCTDMKLTVYHLDVLENIRITYTSSAGSAVEYKYVFTV